MKTVFIKDLKIKKEDIEKFENSGFTTTEKLALEFMDYNGMFRWDAFNSFCDRAGMRLSDAERRKVLRGIYQSGWYRDMNGESVNPIMCYGHLCNVDPAARWSDVPARTVVGLNRFKSEVKVLLYDDDMYLVQENTVYVDEKDCEIFFRYLEMADWKKWEQDPRNMGPDSTMYDIYLKRVTGPSVNRPHTAELPDNHEEYVRELDSLLKKSYMNVYL